jgi:hypothetical protein
MQGGCYWLLLACRYAAGGLSTYEEQAWEGSDLVVKCAVPPLPPPLSS